MGEKNRNSTNHSEMQTMDPRFCHLQRGEARIKLIKRTVIMLRKKPLFSIKTSHVGFFVIYAEHKFNSSWPGTRHFFSFFFFHT